jgi:general nucleoside transport system ATP-binding protein
LPPAGSTKSAPLIAFAGVSKRFGATWANREVFLEIFAGEIHALVGENGAGKSTLMKLIFGHLRPDQGKILLRGKPVSYRHPRAAMRAGIGMVHQQLLIFPQLTVLENILVGAEAGSYGWLNLAQGKRRVLELCRSFGFDVPLDPPAREISYAHRQQIEILRMLHRGAEILLLDEPTSLLAPPEVERLLMLLTNLRNQGCTVVFVSHRLEEVFAVADRISVLADGQLLETVAAVRSSIARVAQRIVGAQSCRSGGARGEERGVSARQPASAGESPEATSVQASCGQSSRPGAPPTGAPPLLVLEGLTTEPSDQETALEHFSLDGVYPGEILGIGGIVGNGQGTLARVLAGFSPLKSGHIYFKGEEITDLSAEQRMELGFRWLPANPLEEALLPSRPLWENLLLGRQRQRACQSHGWLLQKRVRRWGEEQLAVHEVQYASLESPLRDLSGGNQQKVALARVLADRPQLVILEQPTRGLDIGAQERLFQRVGTLNRQGVTFLLFAYDLNELLGLCHRVGVLYRGRLMGVVKSAEAAAGELGKWMLGLGEVRVTANGRGGVP